MGNPKTKLTTSKEGQRDRGLLNSNQESEIAIAMKAKLSLVFFLLALAMAAKVRSFPGSGDMKYFGSHVSPSAVGDLIGEDNELLFDSEASRRSLVQGHSYYNCQRRQRANPYKRGCSA